MPPDRSEFNRLGSRPEKIFIIGEPAAYAMAVRNAESKTRSTHLREKIAAQSSASKS